MQVNGEQPVTFHIVGDAFADLFSFLEGDFPEHGGDSRLSEPVKCFAGGSSINTTTHLKSLIQNSLKQESQVVLHTVLNPSDAYGQLLMQHAQEHEFQLVNCRQENDTSSTGHCVVIVSDGERSFMTHQGCVEKFSAHLIHVDQIIAVDGPVHVHIAGYFNLVGFWHGKLKEQLERIRVERQERFPEQSTTISLVAQHDASNLWDGGLDDLLPFLDFLILNELEANKIIRRGRRGVELPVASNESEVIAGWLSFFSPLSPKTCIIVTRGKDGATSFRDGEIVASTGPAENVEVIDPTGAGDSFAAGFLYGIWNAKRTHGDRKMQDELWPVWTIKDGLHFGCAVGTSAVMIRGASKPSNIETIIDLFEKQKAKERSLVTDPKICCVPSSEVISNT